MAGPFKIFSNGDVVVGTRTNIFRFDMCGKMVKQINMNPQYGIHHDLLEMSDGKFDNGSTATLFLTEWFGGIVAATILAVISWGIYYLIKKESSIIKAFYKSCYFISFISVGSYALGIFLGKF